MYDLKMLDAFASVMRHGSLSAGARECGVPKSTLSRRLQQLEAQVGQPLLRRDGNRMLPTEAGSVFDGYSRTILKLAEESREALSELQEDVCGELSLHVHDALVRGWFAPLMEAFLATHPGVQITLRTRVEAPEPSEKDLLCVWLGPLPDDLGLQQETLGRLTRGIYAHPDYLAAHGTPDDPEDLPHHHWVDLLGDSQDGLVVHHANRGRVSVALPKTRMRVDRMVLQGDAIAAGHGLGVLPHWIVESRLRHHPGTFTACLPEWQAPPLPVRLLYPHGQLPRRSRAFLDFIRANGPRAWMPRGWRPPRENRLETRGAGQDMRQAAS